MAQWSTRCTFTGQSVFRSRCHPYESIGTKFIPYEKRPTLHVCTFVTRKSTRLKDLAVSVCGFVTWIVMNYLLTYLLTYLHRLLAVSLCWWRRTWINCRRTVTPSSSDCRTSCTASRMPNVALSKTSSPNCRLYGTRRSCFFASPLVLSSDRHRR